MTLNPKPTNSKVVTLSSLITPNAKKSSNLVRIRFRFLTRLKINGFKLLVQLVLHNNGKDKRCIIYGIAKKSPQHLLYKQNAYNTIMSGIITLAHV
jgi:hypothetical protein